MLRQLYAAYYRSYSAYFILVNACINYFFWKSVYASSLIFWIYSDIF